MTRTMSIDGRYRYTVYKGQRWLLLIEDDSLYIRKTSPSELAYNASSILGLIPTMFTRNVYRKQAGRKRQKKQNISFCQFAIK